MFGRRKTRDIPEDVTGRFELCDSLRAVVKKEGLDASRLSVGLPVDEQLGSIAIDARSPVVLFDGSKVAGWAVDSLRALFRGDEEVPGDGVLARYPAEFSPMFFVIERNLPLFAQDSRLPPTDGEFLDIFSAMRRRPDGRSLGQLHDFVWMNTALMLGQYRCSENLYKAIMNRLERSARTFRMDAASRNYIDYLCSSFQGGYE